MFVDESVDVVHDFVSVVGAEGVDVVWVKAEFDWGDCGHGCCLSKKNLIGVSLMSTCL